MIRSPLALLLLAACSVALPAPLPTATSVTGRLVVAGALPRSGTLTLQDLAALGDEEVRWTFRDREYAYRGVALDRVLVHCGFDAGPGGNSVAPAERRPGWRNVVVARAADGFTAVFTCAELMPEMGATRALLVWSRDGQPLPADEGPLRLVVPTDKKGSRSVRQLVELRVADVRQLLQPQ